MRKLSVAGTLATALAVLAAGGGTAGAQTACDRAVTAASRPAPAGGAVTPAEVCRVLSALAADSMEGRGTATPGGARAARFIAEEFRRAGLEPAGDSGYFQRVPVVWRQSRSGRMGASRVASFAARDTFPPDRRGLAVNVLGILRGSDPVLKDSVVLVDAHYDHLGLAARAIDVDSMQVWQAMAAPIRAEREAWLTSSGVASRAGRGGRTQMSEAQQAKMREFSQRIAAVRVNMDSIRRIHPTPRRDSVFNGADDDASGSTAVIEIARRLAAGPRPKRTIIFATMTGEEVGLIGTRWYMDHPPIPNTALQANLEIEMIGRPDSLAGGPGHLWLTGFERSTMGEMFRAAGLPVVPDPRPGQSFFSRSDNIAFARMGVPAHTLSSFNLLTDYHQVTDDMSGVDPAHLAAVVNAAVRAVEILANQPAPHWNPGGKP